MRRASSGGRGVGRGTFTGWRSNSYTSDSTANESEVDAQRQRTSPETSSRSRGGSADGNNGDWRQFHHRPRGSWRGSWSADGSRATDPLERSGSWSGGRGRGRASGWTQLRASQSQPHLAAPQREWCTHPSQSLQSSEPSQSSQPHNLLPTSPSFTLMSWNILAQSLLDANRYLYRNTPNRFLTNRTSHILAHIRSHSPDILCVQEIESPVFHDSFVPSLLTHQGHYLQRTGETTTDGLATFINTDRFMIHATQQVLYNTESIGNRHNVGLVHLIECRESNALIIVANTHLLFNPKRGDIKLSQFMALMRSVERVLADYQKSADDSRVASVFVAGDFNFVPESPLHRFVCNSRESNGSKSIASHVFDVRNLARPMDTNRNVGQDDLGNNDGDDNDNVVVAHSRYTEDDYQFRMPSGYGFSLESAYAPHRDAQGDWVSTWHHGDKQLVDFIFYGAAAQSNHAQEGQDQEQEQPNHQSIILDAILKLPDARSMQMMPNRFYPSDHHSLAVKFRVVSSSVMPRSASPLPE